HLHQSRGSEARWTKASACGMRPVLKVLKCWASLSSQTQRTDSMRLAFVLRPVPCWGLQFLTRGFVGMCKAQDTRFVEVSAQYLEHDRELVAGLATRNRNSRDSDQVRGHGVNIREIHCKGILGLLS